MSELAAKIKDQRPNYVVFSKYNSLFESNQDLGFIVSVDNKVFTGEFRYKLYLPHATSDEEEEFDKLSLLNLNPVKIAPFEEECGQYFAYAPVGDDKVLLLSTSE